MKNNIFKLGILAMLLVPVFLNAQVAFKSASTNITVEGTSTLHDWDMKTSSAAVNAAFNFDNSGKPVAVQNISFTLNAQSLKSGKSAMDDNAYKALKTSTHKEIKFAATGGTITHTGGSNYVVKAVGVMTVAGKPVNTDLVANCILQSDGSIKCTGAKAIKMSAYGVKAPSFMMGTIKTGDEITINFNSILKK